MARNCNVLSVPSYSDATQKSILYNKIRNHFLSDGIAIDYWLIAHDIKFNHLHDDKENLDATGELKFEVFMDKIYNDYILQLTSNNPLKHTMSVIKETIDRKIGILQKQITPDAPVTDRKKKLLLDFQILQDLSTKGAMSEALFIIRFVDTLHNLSKDATIRLKNIENSTEISSTDIKDLVDIFNEFAAMGVLEDIVKIKDADYMKNVYSLVDEKNQEINPNADSFLQKIAKTINAKQEADKLFLERGIPLMAEWLLKYNASTINSSTMNLIANIKTYHRGKQFVKQDDEYKRLTQELKDKKITEENYNQQIENLAVQQIKNQNFIGLEELIHSLKLAYKDKSAFSLYLDPFVYTSDKVLGLFARALKEESYKASMKSRDTARKYEKIYDQFVTDSKRGTNNVANFNDGLYEEVDVYDKKQKKMIKRLAFVQKHDVSKYNNNKKKFYDNLHDEIVAELKKKGSTIVQGIDVAQDKETFESWLSTEEGREWKKGQMNNPNIYSLMKKRKVSKWFVENTEAVPDAQKKIKEISDELNLLEKNLKLFNLKRITNTLTAEDEIKLDRIRVTNAERERWWSVNVAGRNQDGTYIPKGTLAVPKAFDNKGNVLYQNSKYTELIKPENKIVFDYYNALFDLYKSDQKRLSASELTNKNPWDDFVYYAPSVAKESKDMYIESHGNVVKAAARDVWDAFSIRDTDTQFGITDETGARTKSIPVFFTHAVEAQYVSKDLISSVLQFHDMTNSFEAKAQIHAQVILIQSIIDNRETAETNSLGQTIWNAVAKKFGSEKVVSQGKHRSNYSQSLEEFIKLVYYNERMEKSTFNLFGKDVSAAKIANKLSMITGINALAFNALQGVNNVMFGNLMFATEVAGGQFFGHKNYLNAERMFWIENGAGIADLGRFNAHTILGQLVEIYDPIQDIQDEFGKNITGSKLKKAFNSDALFFMQHGGEFQMQTQTMLALLDNTTLKDKEGNIIKNEDGSNMTLYQAYKKNAEGTIKLDERVNSIQINTKPNDNLSIDDIRSIIHGLNGKMHGKYNSFDKSVLQRRWYGQLAMLFRGWVVPGIRKRWGFGDGPAIDFETGVVSEGMYQSFIRFVKMGIEDKGKLLTNYKEMTDFEKANVIKTLIEIVTWLSMIAIVRGLASLDLDDDDEELYFIMYELRRTQMDVGFYTNPIEALKILKSPSATMTMVSKITKLLVQLTNPSEVYDRKAGLNEKGDSKLWARTRDLLPILNNIDKARTPSESFQWFSKWYSF